MLAGRLVILGGQHGRLEIDDPAILDKVIAVGVTDRFPARALVDDVSGDGPGLQDSVLASENKQKHALANIFGVWREFLQDIVTKQFLCAAVALVAFHDRGRRKLLNQLAARCEHTGCGQFETRARQNAGNNSPGPRFADRIGCDENVRELHCGFRAQTGRETGHERTGKTTGACKKPSTLKRARISQ
jgi:hypothetical protein